MTVALAVITDGRDDCLAQTIASINQTVDPTLITERFLYDDTGDLDHTATLAVRYPRYTITTAGRRLGFAGAIGFLWDVLCQDSIAEWVLSWEDDFVATRPVPVHEMIAVSRARPHLAQVALRRQAWNPEEIAAGGFVEAAPGWYSEHTDGAHTWLETTRNWTTNPCLFRRELCQVGWADGPESEGRFGFHLRDVGLPWGVPGDQVRFGLWGGYESGREWIRHIGTTRAGTGY